MSNLLKPPPLMTIETHVTTISMSVYNTPKKLCAQLMEFTNSDHIIVMDELFKDWIKVFSTRLETREEQITRLQKDLDSQSMRLKLFKQHVNDIKKNLQYANDNKVTSNEA